MKFSPVKYALNAAVCFAAMVMAILAWMGTIAEFWIISAILIVGATLPLFWFLTIPFGKEKENKALERVKARLEKERTEKED